MVINTSIRKSDGVRCQHPALVDVRKLSFSIQTLTLFYSLLLSQLSALDLLVKRNM